ncbi:hypothetical protein B0A50_07000 [Salinomyces thailandicus]|uniref:S-adenosyl-L-methionine-dependent methyltransferase n=1 Tax=Salinomyces thailandicus TaxID=706561 RepID=A0A4U0TQ38_9PEZI|nr:hypothetical protein B0A50_07000 [Salinomyces thailandica]
MLHTLRPLLKPTPLVGLTSASGLLLAAAVLTRGNSTPKTTATMTTNTTTTTPNPTYPTHPYTPRHKTWPYNPSDFTKQDNSPDPSFYSTPRFVTHIDDAAIASLQLYYDQVLPRKGRILDYCSSWVSHYPASITQAVEKGDLLVTGLGMNQAELAANPVLNNGRILVDLNEKPDIASALRTAGVIPPQPNPETLESSSSSNPSPAEEEEELLLLDASTNVVSTDYLTSPVEILTSLLHATKPGGTVHLVISNRCFPTKAISRWLRVSEEERVMMVGDFLHFAGWEGVEIVEVSDGKVSGGGEGEGEGGGGLRALMALMGGGGRDPLWVVRGVKG